MLDEIMLQEYIGKVYYHPSGQFFYVGIHNQTKEQSGEIEGLITKILALRN
jgi:hypothetical protein